MRAVYPIITLGYRDSEGVYRTHPPEVEVELDDATAEELIARGMAYDPIKPLEALAVEVAEGGATAEVDGEIVDIIELDPEPEPELSSEPAPKGKKK